MKNQFTLYIPNGIGGLFPNLKQLEIILSNLKFIKRANFKEMHFLKDLRLDHNRIEKIEAETFDDLRNLQWLSISDNKIKSIDLRLTHALTELLWFTANENEIEVLDEKYFRMNLKLAGTDVIASQHVEENQI
jgi:Leucine-rich repeat (LRR) protein